MSKSRALTHLNAKGHAHMVDVSAKLETQREAIAKGTLHVSKSTLRLLKQGKTKKSDVLATARVAGISAAKATSTLIPLCHAIALSHVSIEIELKSAHIAVTARCVCSGPTGVEMEALTAASVTLLTLYDMLKAHDRAMTFTVGLEEKRGGRTGSWKRA
jgi:cyclic pyranopterin monophosphate synthase